MNKAVLNMVATVFLGTSMAAIAAPPDHAPAHGWRKKNDGRYVGHTGRDWERDYGIVAGSCDRDAIGAVLGGVAGGVIGSQIGEGSSRNVAIVVGTVLGAVVGHEIGERLDERDRACMGHALELAKEGSSVQWLNKSAGITYVLTPIGGKHQNNACRSFKLKTTAKGKSETRDARACRNGEGVWQMEKR
jgi:surface antigen